MNYRYYYIGSLLWLFLLSNCTSRHGVVKVAIVIKESLARDLSLRLYLEADFRRRRRRPAAHRFSHAAESRSASAACAMSAATCGARCAAPPAGLMPPYACACVPVCVKEKRCHAGTALLFWPARGPMAGGQDTALAVCRQVTPIARTSLLVSPDMHRRHKSTVFETRP